MIKKHNNLIAMTIASALALSACSSGQQSGEHAPSATAVATSSTANQQYHAALSLQGSPAVTTDGKSIVVTVKVTNTGPAAFGTDITPSVNVNLAAHSIDTTGKIIDQDLARATLPNIAPGASATATILLPIDKVLNKSAQILPVEEGVAWFDKWGTKPLTVGPFKGCSSSAVGAVCDDADKPLSAVAAAQP